MTKLDKKSSSELREYWGKKASDFLVGKKIVAVYYHNKEQNEELFGEDDYQSNIRIVFDDGHWITASQDDEGNGSGVIFTTFDDCDKDVNLSVIPSIGLDE